MTQFKQIADNKIIFIVDTSIYNDRVISKVLYWLSEQFIIERNFVTENDQQILLEKKNGLILSGEFDELKIRLNQNFVDFKTRDIVNAETQNIRDILYIKAFANNDDFEDYNLIE